MPNWNVEDETLNMYNAYGKPEELKIDIVSLE